jgi:hypothetical protein
MMQIALTVQHADGSEAKVTAKASDLIAFERHFDQPMTVFGDDKKMRVEWLLWLAWHTSKREKATTHEFDTWVDTVDGITVGDSGE